MHMRNNSAASLRWRSALVLGGLLGLSLLASPAFAQDQAQITAGMKIFRSKGDCQTCHGWAADGRKMDNQMPDGANLRETQLDREGLIFTIKCGRPGAG